MSSQFANVPLQWVGPVKITGPEIDTETEFPLATLPAITWSPSSVMLVSLVCAAAFWIRRRFPVY
jgi:hypothetical protein